MKHLSLEYTETNAFKWALAIVCSLFLMIFFLLFQPFGVNNYRPDEKIEGTFIIGVVIFSVSLFVFLLILEFFVKPKITLKVYSMWVLFEYALVASFLFLVYNALGGFHDFTLASYGRHILEFGTVLLFPFLGTHFYFKHKQVRLDYHTILSEQVSHEIIQLKGEYKKDAIRLPKDSIVCALSEDNYVSLHYLINNQLKKYLIRSPLKNLEAQLNSANVVRCNRSTLVNVKHVHSAKKKGNKMVLELKNYPEPIVVSKSKIDEVQSKLSL